MRRYRQNSSQSYKLEEMKQVLLRFEELEDKLKNKQTERNQLFQKLSQAETSIQNEVFEEQERLSSYIHQDQEKLKALQQEKLDLEKELQTRKLLNQETQTIQQKNQELRENIENQEKEIHSYEQQGLRKEDYDSLQAQIEELEYTQNSLLEQNLHLKQELISHQNANAPLRKSSSAYFESVEEMSGVLCELNQLKYILDSYQNNQEVNVTRLLNFKKQPVHSLDEVLLNVKEITQDLRVQVTDIYAEHCGNTCVNQ